MAEMNQTNQSRFDIEEISSQKFENRFLFRPSSEMAKLYFLLAIFAFVAVTTNWALPLEGLTELEEPQMYYEEPEEYEIEGRADRQRRVTCDLLSFGGVVGDSACAANCLSMGKAGGSCNGGVCVCRRENFMDLWNKRFG